MGHSIKIIVMSATLDTQKISEFMGQAPILDVPGRLFPLDFSYDQRPQHLPILPEFYARLTQKIKEQWTKTSHDILVFLPGLVKFTELSPC